MPDLPTSLQLLLSLHRGEENQQTGVCFELFSFGRDLLLTISGGEGHLGAISLTDGSQQHAYGLKTHEEKVLSNKVLQELHPLLESAGKEILIASGIHYDQILQENIHLILAHCQNLTAELKEKLPAILDSLS